MKCLKSSHFEFPKSDPFHYITPTTGGIYTARDSESSHGGSAEHTAGKSDSDNRGHSAAIRSRSQKDQLHYFRK